MVAVTLQGQAPLVEVRVAPRIFKLQRLLVTFVGLQLYIRYARQ